MIEFFKTIIYEPLYNLLMVIIELIPGGDVGVAVVVITLLVRFLLFPLSKKSIITQRRIKEHQDELNQLKEQYKDDQHQMAQKMMEFYREKEIKPFSSFLLILIQIPIIISLFFIFRETNLPEIQYDLLYDFIQEPSQTSMIFLGLVDISARSMGLAILAGAASFIHMQLSMPTPKKVENPGFKDDFARSMNMQMKYVFPIIIAGVAYSLSAVVALYLLTSNLFTLGQEIFVKRRLKDADSKSSNSKS